MVRMRLSELQYDLPPDLIAQHPIEPRDAARLLVLDRSTGRMEHRIFRDLPYYLSDGDALVVNDTRVLPARFFTRRASGGRVEVLFLHATDADWCVLLKAGGRLRVGEALVCESGGVHLKILERLERGQWLVRPEPAVEAVSFLNLVGQTPLPPYIRRTAPDPLDADRYQTVYANRPGAVAAPTAGMHFTPELLSCLEQAGVRRVSVTLHVGAGTFTPIEVEDLAEHRMHAEWFEVSADALRELGQTRSRGGRIVAVGTTSVRVLESLAAGLIDAANSEPLKGTSGWTDIFIYPPYRFRCVDSLITNFHLPGSTLLALVMAFATPELVRRAYAEAIRRRYRFYSYGDALLIL